MTDPLGRHWQQPPRERVLVDDEHALVSKADFDLLLDYSGSRPTGAYDGKMWRARFRDDWWLMWYANVGDGFGEVKFRKLLVAQ